MKREIIKITCKNWTRITLFIDEKGELMCQLLDKKNEETYLNKRQFKEYFDTLEDENVKYRILIELDEHKKEIDECIELLRDIRHSKETMR